MFVGSETVGRTYGGKGKRGEDVWRGGELWGRHLRGNENVELHRGAKHRGHMWGRRENTGRMYEEDGKRWDSFWGVGGS